MERAFKCKLCSEEFNSRYELDAHSACQHAALLPCIREKLFKCNLCNYEACKERNLINHMRTHTGERPFKCTISGCAIEFKMNNTLKSHIKYKHIKERSFKCKFPGCHHTDKTSTALFIHEKVHSDDRQFSCPECEYKTIRKNNLKTHTMSHHSARRDFHCSHPQCSMSFKSSHDLKRHFSNRHQERNIKCDHPGCGKKFGNANALYKHKWMCHSNKTLACPNVNCSYLTNAAKKLASHMKVHDGRDEKISCSIESCQYKGKNRQAFEAHMRSHRTLLPCPISGCGRYAATKKVLKDHIKLHSPSDRPFQCPLCFKYYTILNELQIHCFSHTNEKPFACGHCEYAGPFRSGVKKHISSVHTNIKFPFVAHLLNDRECLDCKLTLPTAEFLVHYKDHDVLQHIMPACWLIDGKTGNN